MLTTRLAAVVPSEWHAATLDAVRAIHTGIFASVGGAILVVIWDGIRQRPGRRTAVAAGVVLVESAVFASNNQVCPLTPLAEQLGAERGSVADLFLPDWISRRIPIVGSIGLALGLALNLGAWLRAMRPDWAANRVRSVGGMIVARC